MKRFDCMTALAAKLKEELNRGQSARRERRRVVQRRARICAPRNLFPAAARLRHAAGLRVGGSRIKPHRRIISLDTDGGILFNLGILATLGNEQPKNLLVVVWDNECYQSDRRPTYPYGLRSCRHRPHQPLGIGIESMPI